MLWYEGNIAEAIQKSRQEGAVFGVAIFGRLSLFCYHLVQKHITYVNVSYVNS